jgi:Ca2+-binding RTX toxin-like protein
MDLRGVRRIERAIAEVLELRRMLSASAEVIDGTLLIRGTSGEDDVWIWGGDAFLGVVLNGQKREFTRRHFDAVEVHLGDGDDRIIGDFADHPVRVFGGGGDDRITAGTGRDTLVGGGGNDTIHDGLHWTSMGLTENDRLRGGNGDDTIHAYGGDDTIKGDAGADELYGGVGNDVLRGDEDDAVLDGQAGDNLVLRS